MDRVLRANCARSARLRLAHGACQGSSVNPPPSVLFSRIAQGGLVNHIHYLMQFLWVMANLVWAYGELFFPVVYDDPMPLFPVTLQDLHSMRWLSSWILVVAFVLGVVLHVVWIAKGTEFPPTYSSLYSAR